MDTDVDYKTNAESPDSPPSESHGQVSFERRLVQALLILALIFLAARFVNLHYDTPLFYAGYSASEISDPYMYTSFARNKVLFDDWDPFDYDRWTSWRTSLVSGAAYLIFSIAGVSRVTANLTGVLLHLGGAFFLLLAMWRIRSRLETTLTAFFLLAASGFFFPGRLPMLEGGLVFLSGLAVWVYFRIGRTIFGVALVGCLLALGMFAGKLTGVALLAPIVVYALVDGIRTGGMRLGYLGLGMFAGAFLYAALFYDSSLSGMIGYYQGQTAAVGLAPEIPGSPWNALGTFLSYGASNGVFRFQPVLIFLAVAGLYLASRVSVKTERTPDFNSNHASSSLSESWPGFMAFWLIAGVIMLALYVYRPARYFVPLFLPLCALAGYAANALLSGSTNGALSEPRLRWKTWLSGSVLLVGCLYLASQVSVEAVRLATDAAPGVPRIPWQAPITGMFVGIGLLWALRNGTALPQIFRRFAGLFLLALFGIHQGALVYQGLTQPHNSLQLQVQDIGALLGEEAVIAGNYGPAFTIDNNLGAIIHSFTAPKYEEDFFERFDVTHVAIVPGALETLVKRYPGMKQAISVAQVWTRDGSFMILRTPYARNQPTDYEQGMMFLARSALDSASHYFDRFLDQSPESFRGRWGQIRVWAYQKKITRANEELERLATEYEDLFYAHYLVAWEYLTLFRATGDSLFYDTAMRHYGLGHDLNPTLKLDRTF